MGLMFASRIVGNSEVKLSQQKGDSRRRSRYRELRHNAYRHFDMPNLSVLLLHDDKNRR